MADQFYEMSAVLLTIWALLQVAPAAPVELARFRLLAKPVQTRQADLSPSRAVLRLLHQDFQQGHLLDSQCHLPADQTAYAAWNSCAQMPQDSAPRLRVSRKCQQGAL